MNENTAEKLETEEQVTTPELEVEVIDDTPEQDKDRPARTEGTKPDIPEDDEISSQWRRKRCSGRCETVSDRKGREDGMERYRSGVGI